MKQFYPTAGAVAGGAVGSLAGPSGAALGAGGGAMLGELARGNEDLKEAKETIEVLTGKQQLSMDTFFAKIQRILITVGLCLIGYLVVPLFVAKRSARAEVLKCSKNDTNPKN